MSAEKKRVAFHTHGCKLNFTETSTIARSLDVDRYIRVPEGEPADIYIINTCTVTSAADRKCRQSIRKTISHANDDAYVVVVGCYAQLKPDEISAIEGVDLVLGVNEKFNLSSYLDRIEESPSSEIHTCDSNEFHTFSSSYSLGDRTRSFLKVQDGCDYKCSYCTVPLARGGSRNQPVSECVSQANEIAASGVKEIVLTGVNIGDFGKTTGESFYDLLKELVKIDAIERYRISSIEPNLLTDEIIDLVAQSGGKIAPHFHIPLQSGCDTILKRMRRRYLRNVFAGRVDVIRKKIPQAAIGADVIAGFPGETDEEFTQTFSFLDSLDVSYLHSFSYSARPGTEAETINQKVASEVIHERSMRLRRLSEKKRLIFYRRFSGQTLKVIWENSHIDESITGYTGNYIRVKTSEKNVSPGNMSVVTLREPDENGIFDVRFNPGP